MTRRRKQQPLDLELCAQVASTCPAMALGRATRYIESVFADAFEGTGLGTRQFSLLVAVALRGPCTVSQLARVRGLSPATVSRNLVRLERDGAVQVTSGEDRRERMVSLSKAGKKTLSTALEAWQSAMRELEATVGRQRLRELHALSREVRDALDD